MIRVTTGRIGRTAASMLALMALAAFSVAARSQDALAADDYLKRVDPELRALASQFGKGTDFTNENLQSFRAAPIPKPDPDPPFFKKTIKGLAGQPDVSIIVVNAKPGTSRPGILHTHGGGFVVGWAEENPGLIQSFAKRLDVTIVSVDYRLAPETKWAGIGGGQLRRFEMDVRPRCGAGCGSTPPGCDGRERGRRTCSAARHRG